MIQQTSLEAYRQILPRLGSAQTQIFNIIIHPSLKDGITNMEIARVLGWSINRVTPRVKELREKGVVVEMDKRFCQVTGRRAIAWRKA